MAMIDAGTSPRLFRVSKHKVTLQTGLLTGVMGARTETEIGMGMQ
jgi:hypothetical protein